MAASAKASEIGKKSRDNGALFEKYIIKSCAEYERRGIAYIQKNPEPMHIIKPYGQNGWFVTNFAKKAQPDFKGVLKGGRTVIFDAKHTDKDRILQTAINEVQAEFLDGYEKLGAICFVLVSIGMENFYRVPWMVWKDMKSMFKHKYMNADDLKPYKVKGSIQNIQFLPEV